MSLNCKKGDLARIVWPDSASNGRFVTVEEFIPQGRVFWFEGVHLKASLPGWIVHCQTSVDTVVGHRHRFPVEDRYLRPIRGADGVDEVLIRTGLPAPRETVPA